MNEPPDGLYQKPYDPEGTPAYTADRQRITQGLRVFTNNLDRGTVDLTDARWEWHGPENRYHLWFYVDVDTNYKGEPVTQRYSQADDRVATRFEGKAA
ncbi:hypothetical protein [Mycolicibacterium sp.]|uniref:hypothetical protein n=1 Tax=Mycolicibacterium sp. TaxID=2320850 RepID=UPI0037C7102B